MTPNIYSIANRGIASNIGVGFQRPLGVGPFWHTTSVKRRLHEALPIHREPDRIDPEICVALRSKFTSRLCHDFQGEIRDSA